MIDDYINGKRIAVVGNAKSLFQQSYGRQIDDHDIVIRINKPAIFYDDQPCIESHGTRIDLWAFWDYGFFKNTMDRQNLPPRLNEFFNHGDFGVFNANMRQRKKYFLWGRENEPIYGLTRDKLIAENIGKHTDKYERKNPSTGLLLLLTLKYFNPSEVNVYGFDFKRTPTFGQEDKYKFVNGKHRWDMTCAHEFAFEEFVAEHEIFSDERFNLKGVHWKREKSDKYQY